MNDLFEQRAQLVQDYDSQHMGRFERHIAGFNMMVQKPLGIGAMEFGKMLGEDEHNLYLKSLTTYGWLGFVALFTLIAWTLLAALPLLFRGGPLQDIVQITYVVLLCHVFMAMVIDLDHWRHFYLMFGMLWGAIAVDRRQRSDALRRRYVNGGAAPRPVAT